MNFGSSIADLFAGVQTEGNGNGSAASPSTQPAPRVEGKPQDRQGERTFLELNSLEMDRRLQQRAELYDYGYIDEKLRVVLREMEIDPEDKVQPVKTMPAIEVWLVGGVYYVVDGFQRAESHRLEGFRYIEADVYRGTFYEARARSFLVNRHGKSLTERDLDHKLNAALEFYQEDLMNGRMSLNAFAAKTDMSVAFVSKALDRLGIELPGEVMVTRTRKTKAGETVTSTYPMKTGKIGRPKKTIDDDVDDGDDDDIDEAINGNMPARAKVAGSKAGHRGAEVIQGYQSVTFADEGLDLGDDDAGSGEVSPPNGLPSSVSLSANGRSARLPDEMVLYVPVWAVEELRDLVLNQGSVKLQEALKDQLF